MRDLPRSILRVRWRRTAQSIGLVIVCAVGIFTNPIDVRCQPSGCVSVEYNVSTPPPQGFFTALAPAVCHDDAGNVTNDQTLNEGGYVKLATPLRIDTEAHVTGACDVWIWDWWFWYCQPWGTQIRTLIRVTLGIIPPTQLASYQYIPADNQATSLDTRNGQGIGTPLSEVGTHHFTFQSSAYGNACTPPMNSSILDKSIYAVSCLPLWKQDINGNLPRFQIDGTPIKIAYPIGLAQDAEPAIDAWKDKLAQWGLNLDLQKSAGGSCAVADGHCVLIQAPVLCPDNPSACGCRIPPASPDGVYTTRTNIYLRPGYDSWPDAAFRQATIAHELGHAFSLGHRAPGEDCTDAPGSVMNSPVQCGTLGSLLTTPTDNDAIAVAKTVYPIGPRKTCGW